MNNQPRIWTDKFYTGFWGILTKWFRIPKDPPTLGSHPSDKVISFKPADGYLNYRKLEFLIIFAVLDSVIFFAWLALLIFVPTAGILTAPFIAVILTFVNLAIWLAIHLRYDTTWYVMSDRSIRLRRGIWIITEMTLTFENIQNVKVTQGPIQRYFGIFDVIIETAGGGGSEHPGKDQPLISMHRGVIEGVSNAHEVRDLILKRMKKSQSAGLGDDTISKAQPMWTPEHLQVLREIKSLLPSTPFRHHNT